MLKKLSRLLLFAATVQCASIAYAVEMQGLDVERFNYVMSEKGPITVLFIFTSWCGVCKDAIPEVFDLAKKYSDGSVRIVMLSLDEKIEKVQEVINKYDQYDHKIYYFDEKIARKDVGMALFKNGVRYKGTIPHITIFHNDKVIADDSYEIQSVKNFVHQLHEKNGNM